MPVLIGTWFALAGGVAALAGLSGMRRVRRLRRLGQTAWAMALPRSSGTGETGDGSPRRTMIQFALDDGRVIERMCPRPARGGAPLSPGQKVLVWYDPSDPHDVLVCGREGRGSDRAFAAVGAFFILVGVAVAVFGH